MSKEICSIHATQYDLATTSIDMNATFEESMFLVGRILQSIMSHNDMTALQVLRVLCLVLDELLEKDEDDQQFEWSMNAEGIKQMLKDYLAPGGNDESEET